MNMKAMEIQRKLRWLDEVTMKRSKTTILREEGETEEFEFNIGVRQGWSVDKAFHNILGCDN